MPEHTTLKATPDDTKIKAIIEVIDDELMISEMELDHLENFYACCQDIETERKIAGIKLEHKILNILRSEIEEIKNPTRHEPCDVTRLLSLIR